MKTAKELAAAALERDKRRRAPTPGGIAGLAARGAIDALGQAGVAGELAAGARALDQVLGDKGRACLAAGDVGGACRIVLEELLRNAGDNAVEQLRVAWVEKVRPRR